LYINCGTIMILREWKIVRHFEKCLKWYIMSERCISSCNKNVGNIYCYGFVFIPTYTLAITKYMDTVFITVKYISFPLLIVICFLVKSDMNLKKFPFLAHLSWKLKWATLITHCPSSVCLAVRLSVNFLHFRLLLQNHWANFNQTWHKSSLGEGILNC
jgi:hypothetical protein